VSYLQGEGFKSAWCLRHHLALNTRKLPEEEAGSTDKEAEEIGSEGAQPCAWKLCHIILSRKTLLIWSQKSSMSVVAS
jgi:hypothetical protein